jgi:cytochrome P450
MDAMSQATQQPRWKDPAWHRDMRDGNPVWLDPATKVWHVFRYADAATVLADHQTFSSDLSRIFPDRAELTEGNILAMDPPRHHRLRSLVSRAFTPRAIARLDGRIAELTTELLDATEGREHIELVADLAYPLPVTVIAELLGVPAADRALFKEWADALLSQETTDPNDQAAIEESARELGKFHEYLREHVTDRRRRPRPDLLGNLVAAEIDGERLEDDEIVGFAAILLLAGHITTTVLLGNSIRCLDEHLGAQRALRADPSGIPAAIEEVIRYTTPFAQVTRVTATDVEIGGQAVPVGQLVSVWTAAANRDERQFADPDTFLVDRQPNPHLGFGKGVHFCIGAPLARLEGRIALGILLRRYDAIRVDRDHPLEPYADPGINGVHALHLLVEPARR